MAMKKLIYIMFIVAFLFICIGKSESYIKMSSQIKMIGKCCTKTNKADDTANESAFSFFPTYWWDAKMFIW
jgi:hypothetical protein